MRKDGEEAPERLEREAEQELAEWADRWADRLPEGELRLAANRLRRLDPERQQAA
jgi:hypothetical protein